MPPCQLVCFGQSRFQQQKATISFGDLLRLPYERAHLSLCSASHTYQWRSPTAKSRPAQPGWCCCGSHYLCHHATRPYVLHVSAVKVNDADCNPAGELMPFTMPHCGNANASAAPIILLVPLPRHKRCIIPIGLPFIDYSTTLTMASRGGCGGGCNNPVAVDTTCESLALAIVAAVVQTGHTIPLAVKNKIDKMESKTQQVTCCTFRMSY